MTLENLLRIKSEGNQVLQNQIGLQPQNTRIVGYNQEDWKTFIEQNDLDESYGLFNDLTNKAYVNTANQYSDITLFHEYHGHGTAHENFEKANRSLPSLTDTTKIEGFATWIEAVVSNETNREHKFKQKMSEQPPFYHQVLGLFEQIQKDLTELGLLGSLGMPKKYDSEDVGELLERIKPDEEILLAMLYGSRKPLSDIDIFLVTDKQSMSVTNEWLDIYQINKEKIEDKVRNLDISVTEPLFTGQRILGRESYLQNLKDIATNTEITQETIQYNKAEIKRFKDYIEKENAERVQLHKSYIDSFQQNTELLKKGIRPLTRENLQRYSSET